MEKINVCGITAEYNPFHNGHMYQIQKTRERTQCDVMIAVMSGNFVQRGEPALIDKWARAEAAVRNGIDLVIELPYVYSTQSATQFAHGAVSLLKLAGVTSISFGSECGNLENLLEIAETSVNPDHLHQSMDKGMSFPRSYSLLTTQMRPNDILAVAYLKEIAGTDIEPILIQRTTNYLDEEIHETASALAIRTALKKKLPFEETTPMADMIHSLPHVTVDQFYPYLRTFLLTTSKERLSSFFLFNEGIENHLVEQAQKNSTYEGFLRDCVNWRYTASRIRRTTLQAIMQVTKEEVKCLPKADTLRVLAFNDTGRKYLHNMRKSNTRFISRFAEVPFPYREMEYRAALLYTSCMNENDRTKVLQNEIGGAHYIR